MATVPPPWTPLFCPARPFSLSFLAPVPIRERGSYLVPRVFVRHVERAIGGCESVQIDLTEMNVVYDDASKRNLGALYSFWFFFFFLVFFYSKPLTVC